VALGLARFARMNPIKIADIITKHMGKPDFLAEISVARPGFINFRLTTDWLTQQVSRIIQAGDDFGKINIGQNKRVQVEFISANPTGPLQFGSGRNAIIGDVLANVFSAVGYDIQREYYMNDTGNQTLLFAQTLRSRYAKSLGKEDRFPFPKDGYPGDYLIEMGQKLADNVGTAYLDLADNESIATFQQEGLNYMVSHLKNEVATMNIHFDNWFSERSLYDDGTYQKIYQYLQEHDQLVKKDGAVWLKGNEDDENYVLVRSDGRPTYLASDIAYMYNKLVTRNFEKAIYILGADHHGYMSRLGTVAQILGLDEERVVIVMYQLVSLERDGKQVRMGKRSEFVPLSKVIEEIGVDATRFMLLTRSSDSQMTLDLSLAVQESSENPVYYVQYGHARIASIFRKAEAEGVSMKNADLSLLTNPSELDLIRHTLRLEEVLEYIALTLSPNHLTTYAQELATVFHRFYHDCRVISDDLALSAARLSLVKATQITLANTLRLMGMSTPEQM